MGDRIPAVAGVGGVPLAAAASPALADSDNQGLVGSRTPEILAQRRLSKSPSRARLMRRLLLAADLVGLLAAASIGASLVGGHSIPVSLLVASAAAVIFVPAARAGARTVGRTRPSYIQNTVVVGGGDVGQAVAARLLRHPEYGLNLVGFIDSEPKELGPATRPA